jgi:hypothetical protein
VFDGVPPTDELWFDLPKFFGVNSGNLSVFNSVLPRGKAEIGSDGRTNKFKLSYSLEILPVLVPISLWVLK